MSWGEILRHRERLLAVQYGAEYPPKGPDGEDLECDDVADVEHWVKVYTELVDFTRGLLADASPPAPAEGHPARGEAGSHMRALTLLARVQELHLIYWVSRLDQLRSEAGCDASSPVSGGPTPS